MFGKGDEFLPRDAIFGDFEVVEYQHAGNRSPLTDFFLDLWRQKGGEQKAISRADITPREMKQYLEHVVLMDVVRDQNTWRLQVRLVGSHVANFYGDITGKDIRVMENSKAIERIYFISGKVIEGKEPAMTVSPAFSPDKLYMEAVALYMPLFDKDGEVNKIMVAVHVASSPGHY